MFNKTTVFDCSLLYLPRIHDIAGNLTSINEQQEIPFKIKRIYYLYDIPGGETRGGHAHKELVQLIVAASGSFDILIDDGKAKRTVMLNRPYMGLLLVPGIWRELLNFSSGAICLVLASELYDEKDYVMDHNEFCRSKNETQQLG